MRIEAYTQVQQLYKTTKNKKTNAVSKIGKKDAFEISSMGRDMQTAKAAVAQAPDVREDVVAPIRTSIANGSYSVSGESFAEKLLAKYNA